MELDREGDIGTISVGNPNFIERMLLQYDIKYS